jgi:hypothetical protein
MRYYKKELLSTRLYLPNGGTARFTDIGLDTGILATTDPYIISELDKCAARSVGGVSKIDQALYEELKKNNLARLQSQSSSPDSLLPNNPIHQLLSSPKRNHAAVSSTASPPIPTAIKESEPLKVPDKLPTVKKIKKKTE